jgi:uncharacterized protein YhbP (UPF0306 family)
MADNSRTVKRAVIQTLAQTPLMQIATSVGNRPRVANVWFSYDDKLNLYFISRKDRLHSRELRGQPKVAGAIVNSKFARPGRRVRGVTFQGRAREVPREKITEAYAFYRRRYPIISGSVTLAELRTGSTGMKIYKVTPAAYMLFDEVNFPEHPSKHWSLKMRSR